MTTNMPPEEPEVAHEAALGPLFGWAYRAAPVELIYTLLRVGGHQMADWDAFQESRSAFNDYRWMLAKVHEGRGETAARRVGLLMYCQAVEMNAVHEILVNLLRCRAGVGYSPAPLRHLGRRKKKPKGLEAFTNYSPPSAKTKINAIKQLAAHVEYPELSAAIDRFFDERVRNAFFHSDYILTEKYFRFREGGLAQQIDVEALDRLITDCLSFYGVFLDLHDQWLHALGRGKRFHKWPNYEVLELLSTEDEGLYGFNVHFSNGTKATYMRRKQTGTMGSVNLFFDKSGINFNVGQLETLESVWKIDGKPVEDWDALP